MVTEEQIIEYCKDIKFLKRLEQIIAGFCKLSNPAKNLAVKGVYNADIYMLEGIAILGKVSKLSKSERDEILFIIEFAIKNYEQWKRGDSE